jgi:restriction endonuclease Mrr
MSAQPSQFATLFDKPDRGIMRKLSPRDFERFVAYVLRRAGFDVKEVGRNFLRGLDLELRLPGKQQIFGGVECKRYTEDRPVRVPAVRGVRGAAAVKRRGAKPFVITTSDFVPDAHKEAHADKSKIVHLMNGAQLLRFITYVKGSRHGFASKVDSHSDF